MFSHKVILIEKYPGFCVPLQTCTSLKVNIDSWNILTTHWLRHTVYERFHPSVAVWAVFVVSAFWHGFYPGYYIAFLTAALFTTAARLVGWPCSYAKIWWAQLLLLVIVLKVWLSLSVISSEMSVLFLLCIICSYIPLYVFLYILVIGHDITHRVLRCSNTKQSLYEHNITTPAGHRTRMKQILTCNDVYIIIKFCHHVSKETGCSRKTEADWQLLRWKPHMLKNAKFLIAHVRCMLFILSSLIEKNIFVFKFLVFRNEVQCLCRCNMYLCKYTSLVEVRLIKHRSVPGRASSSALTGIGRFKKRFSKDHGAFQTLYTVQCLKNGPKIVPFDKIDAVRCRKMICDLSRETHILQQ